MADAISKRLAAGAALAALVLQAPALAQDAPPENCNLDPEYHQFDFWVGEWDVSTPDGRRAGENTITKRDGDCVILEEWNSAGGGSGSSINYFDPIDGAWRQIWISPSEIIEMAGGLDSEGAMVLEGSIQPRGAEQRERFRGVWTPLPGGEVRQHFETFDAEAGEWSGWFTGVYRRKEEG